MTTNSTEDTIKKLNELDGSNDRPNDGDRQQMEKCKEMCRMINVNLKEFYDDIFIPLSYFRNEQWDIAKVLYDNEDSLFYNEKYLPPDDHNRFYEVFDKYVTMVEDIMSPENKLYLFLKKWTDTSETKWKQNNTQSYLKNILLKRKYQVISPGYIANLYYNLCKKYRNDLEKMKEEFEKYLDTIIANMRKEIKIFKKIYNKIVDSYVYENPINNTSNDIYICGFINSIILAVLDFAEKLIEQNIYAIHPIVMDIIGYYTPLDDIYLYNPDEYGNRKLCIV